MDNIDNRISDHYRAYKIKRLKDIIESINTNEIIGGLSNDEDTNKALAILLSAYLVFYFCKDAFAELSVFDFPLISTVNKIYNFGAGALLVAIDLAIAWVLSLVLAKTVFPAFWTIREYILEAKSDYYHKKYRRECDLFEKVKKLQNSIEYKNIYYHVPYVMPRAKMSKEYYDMDPHVWNILYRFMFYETEAKINEHSEKSIVPKRKIVVNQYMSYDFFIKYGGTILYLYANQIAFPRRPKLRNVAFLYELDNGKFIGYSDAKLSRIDENVIKDIEKSGYRYLGSPGRHIVCYEGFHS